MAKGKDKQPKDKGKIGNTIRLTVFWAVILIGIAVFWSIGTPAQNLKEVPISDVIARANKGEITRIEGQGGDLKITIKGKDKPTEKSYIQGGVATLLKEKTLSPEAKAVVEDKAPSQTGDTIWQLAMVFVPVVLIVAFFMYMMRQAQGQNNQAMGFGKSKAKLYGLDKERVVFNDIAGNDSAKQDLEEVVDFLKHPKKYQQLGAKIPKGVLLVGNPGTGKTMLARAVAGEANVPFFSISGSEFVEMFVGVGASRVRDLFTKAKKNAPCIIFIDEIDAVGRKRGSGMGGGHDEREQTLNAILVEMDGFTPADGVIVIAATNRADVLDPALIRPGRFDRQITVPLPDVKGRVEILKVHAKKIKLGPDVDLERIARGTPMFSGADLAAIINEAAIMATMAEKEHVEHADLEEARDKVKFGRAKKSRVREKEENRLVAYHEAGHAVLQALLKDADPLHKVTIIPRGGMGGATFSLPSKDRMGYSLKWLGATMRVACGGRIAEEKAMGDVSSGAQQDILQVTSIARAMVLEWGMSKNLGFVRYAGLDTRESMMPDKDYSEETARLIDEEVRRIVDEAYAEAERLIEANWEKVVAVAEALLKYETLSSDDVEKLMRGEVLTRPALASESARAEERRRAARAVVEQLDRTEPDVPPGTLPSPA